MLNKKKSFFISYDGLSDSLGQSQIIPYILDISMHPRELFLLTFEKKNKFLKLRNKIEKIINEHNIKWYRFNFTSRFGKLGKAYDLLKLIIVSIYVTLRFEIKIVHGRGLIPSLVSLLLKKIFFFKKIKNIFDCRGLWADERFDNNILNKNKILDKFLYKILKYLEKQCIFKSSHIVFLTKKVKHELESQYKIKFSHTSIIPCCVDFNKFNFNNKETFNITYRKKLNIPKDSIVFNYNGSLKGVYLFEEMLIFFNKFRCLIPNSFFVITSPDTKFAEKIVIEKYKNLRKYIVINEALHSEIPNYLSISNFSIGFIKKTFARCAMSPTKLAESLAMGVPVIYNDKIGDVTSIILNLEAGIVIDYKKNSDIENFTKNYKKIINMGGKKLVLNAKSFFDISVANKKYLAIYNKLDV